MIIKIIALFAFRSRGLILIAMERVPSAHSLVHVSIESVFFTNHAWKRELSVAFIKDDCSWTEHFHTTEMTAKLSQHSINILAWIYHKSLFKKKVKDVLWLPLNEKVEHSNHYRTCHITGQYTEKKQISLMIIVKVTFPLWFGQDESSKRAYYSPIKMLFVYFWFLWIKSF